MGNKKNDSMGDMDGADLKAKKQSSLSGMGSAAKRFLMIGTSDKDSKAAAAKRKVTRSVKNLEDDNSEHSEFEVVQHPDRPAEERKGSIVKKSKNISNKQLAQQFDTAKFNLQANHIERLTEVNMRQKHQMKNATKNLMKVDEFLA